MKNENKLGWFHTGTDSFDNPEVEFLAVVNAPINFGHGPFKTREAAVKDFKKMVTSDIRNLQDLYDGVLRLEGKNEKTKTKKR